MSKKPQVLFVHAQRVEKLPIYIFLFPLDHFYLLAWQRTLHHPVSRRPQRSLPSIPSLPQTEGRGSDKAQPSHEIHHLGSSLPLQALSPPCPALPSLPPIFSLHWMKVLAVCDSLGLGLRYKGRFLRGAGWMLSNGK